MPPPTGSSLVSRTETEVAFGSCTACGAQPLGQTRVPQQGQDRGCERVGVVRRYQEAVPPVLHDLGKPAHPTGHHRASREPGLDHPGRQARFG